MKICIFGKHPGAKSGFEGVMSIYEALWLSKMGHQVDLYHPFKNCAELNSILDNASVDCLNSFTKLGGNFNAIPIYPNNRLLDKYDFGIWQSYTHWEYESFFSTFKNSCAFTTKNYPKFIPDYSYIQRGEIKPHFDDFDLIACSLLSDYELMAKGVDDGLIDSKRFCYAPRGADSHRVLNNNKPKVPTIGIDSPIGADFRAVKPIITALEIVKKEIPELQTLSFNKTYSEINSVRVPPSSFLNFYNSFINKLWGYCSINYQYSPAHIQADVQKQNPSWKYRAIYEVQNIEAQMAGACVIGHQSNVIDELIFESNKEFIYTDFADSEDIANKIKQCINNNDEVNHKSRAFAEQNFEWSICLKKWELGMIQFMAGFQSGIK